MDKEILDKIVECLAIIAVNPNVCSKSLILELSNLAEMINKKETKDEKEKEG